MARPAHHTDSPISCRFSIRGTSHSSAAMRDAVELQPVPALEEDIHLLLAFFIEGKR
jgi:hypothetical protein